MKNNKQIQSAFEQNKGCRSPEVNDNHKFRFEERARKKSRARSVQIKEKTKWG